MDQTFLSYTSSLSSSSYQQEHPPKTIKPTRPSYLDSLHSVRRALPKPMTKQFIAPLPPTPPKVYNVDSSDFKKVVRVLTSSPEFQYPPERSMKDIAPPPLILSITPKLRPPPPPPLSLEFCNFLNETMDATRFTSTSPAMDYFEGALMSPLGFSLSPTSLSWCSSVLLSPGYN